MCFNKGILVIGLLFLQLTIHAQIRIDGKVSSFNGSKGISLFVVQEGTLTLHDFQILDVDSTFSFAIDHAPTGFYYLGSSENPKSVFGDCYMKAGQQARLIIENKKIVPASLPNQQAYAYQHHWEELNNGALEGTWLKAREAKHVEDVITKHHKALNDFKASLRSDDPTLNQLMKLKAQAEFDMHWLRNFSMVPPDARAILKKSPIMQEMYNRPHTSADILKIKDGAMASGMFTSFKAYWQSYKGKNYLEFSLNVFDNDTLRGRYLTNYIIQRSISGKYFNQVMAAYGDLIVTDLQQKELKAYETQIMKFAEGADAFDFEYPDAQGKMHALSDYKGKLVLVDIWATWCAPCKAEIPHLEQLMKNYTDNDEIVFISVSIDKNREKEKWLAFIDEHHLGGIQLLADYAFESDIIYDYEINGVPRFMLFNKDGKILTVNAPRPSNPQLKELIDEYL
ncbi:TlpA family protein disulfide reductase [Carboxylicivirga sp. RSCT41]|uniref:TlpA family protein disulfide reductase n=1 Tax=Carboxylicivirga agarovorans TaxID=3417570 RepID=UPI003D332B45